MSKATHQARWGGRRLLRARQWAMRNLGWTCWLCGHEIEPGDYTIDHVIPLSVDPTLAWDVTNWRPAHGRSHPALGCSGNYGRGNRDANRVPRVSRAW